jgi:biopolymer transport protein ExbB/biopolymer transport protein TolQ
MLIERLMKLALLGSEWVLYVLFSLSVISIATILERLWFFARRTGGGEPLRLAVSDLLRDGSVAAAVKLLAGKKTLEARIGHQALLWANCGPDAVDDAVESELTRVRKELERGSNFLGTVGNNSPFIGLFGTVLGVIIAFHALGSAAQNANSMNGVMAGIAEALVATGVGLLVAIPAVVAYNVLQKKIGEVEADALSMVKTITAHLKANPEAFAEPVEEELAKVRETVEEPEPVSVRSPADGAAA